MENLQQLITLKSQLEELESKFKFQKELALDEALAFKAENDKAKIPLDGGSVTIRLKNVKPTPETDSDLDSIKQDIDSEIERIQLSNAAGIDAVTQQIEDLQAQLNLLTTSKRLKALQKEYDSRVTEITEIVPELAVSLK
ncbi:MAG: hypothetical protein KME47_09920 [Nodosilinea sp. WJT8-NPBG4]|jgi:copper chaperone CopZ|nr:hypothetical protein [Nodosilinea sp. WJT8-NPBG4]